MPVPATEDTLLLFVAYLHRKNCCHSTVSVYMSAIRSLHIFQGLADPLPKYLRLKLAVRAIGTLSGPPRQKLPLTFSILEKISKYIGTSYNDSMLWCALLLGYFGCLRAAEFATAGPTYLASRHLSLSDVRIQSPDSSQTPCLILHIKHSKTDIFSRGVEIYIGCTGHQMCAVCTMQHYLKLRKSIIPHQQTDPLFIFQNGVVLSKTLLSKQLKLILALAGIDPSQYSGHSLRAGAATDAAASGLPDWQIGMLGRWTSNTYQRYIRTPIEFRTTLAKAMIRARIN